VGVPKQLSRDIPLPTFRGHQFVVEKWNGIHELQNRRNANHLTPLIALHNTLLIRSLPSQAHMLQLGGEIEGMSSIFNESKQVKNTEKSARLTRVSHYCLSYNFVILTSDFKER